MYQINPASAIVDLVENGSAESSKFKASRAEISVAYIVTRFPSVTETFVLNEMLELQKRGFDPQVYTLLFTRGVVEHTGIQQFVRDLVHVRALSFRCISAQFYWLCRRPVTLIKLWADAIRGNSRSLKFLSRTLVTLPIAAVFARTVHARQVQHVHAHFATHSALAALVIHRLTGVPYSITVHAHDLYVNRSMLHVKLKESAFIATISQFNSNLMGDLYGDEIAKKISIVRCGVDGNRFKQTRTDSTGDIAENIIPQIVCVGSLQEYKGQRYLIEACAGLVKRGLRFNCELIGDGNQRVALQNQIDEAGLHYCVKLAGARSSAQIIATLQCADIFVLPSIVTASGKMEGIPVALMEAMAMELPVVTTNLSGIPELVSDDTTGVLVEPGDAAALCDALTILITDVEKRKALGKAARDLVLAEFNIATGAEILASLIRDVRTAKH